ncbi:hypothetical protein AZL_018870 [Azospirillum sp. B510]|uniref:helix-turn-helix transcriptional regulator n=1 Tax=Azospirillum sp. (strain B510) TaxID=137722 RepID=UPI0001C4C2A1|nr:hypothetical protein [Azospirillum sp. B510]BAI72525.1 hypothetical protein AZL_018870 [Azospirillum sp. B510]
MLALPSDIPRPFEDMAVLASRLDATMVVFDEKDCVRYVSPRKRQIYSFCDFSAPMTFDQMFMKSWEHGVAMGRLGAVGAEDELQDTKRRRLRDRLEFTKHVPTKLLCSHARISSGWNAQLRVEPARAGLDHFFMADLPTMGLTEIIREREAAALRAAALDCLEIGVAVVACDGKVRYKNAAMSAAISSEIGWWVDEAGRLHFDGGASTHGLARLISAAATGAAPSPTTTIRLQRPGDPAPYMASISRGPGRLEDTAVIAVALPTMGTASVIDVLRQEYDLTATEAKLAAMVGAGQETSAAAEALGKTAGSGRTMMKSVYRKLAEKSIPVSGQSALTRWVSMLAAITGASRRRDH